MQKVISLWSAGIDSTAVTFHLAKKGYEVYPYYLIWRLGNVFIKECKVIKRLYNKYKKVYPNLHEPKFVIDKKLMKDISQNISHRNRLILDYVAKEIVPKHNTNLLGMGEYKSNHSDTWVNNWSVPVNDCDPEALQKYVDKYKLKIIIMDDFGKAEFKHERVAMLKEVIGEDTFITTSCGYGGNGIDCGKCYLCAEVHVAKLKTFGYDKTKYSTDPKENIYFPEYCVQMKYLDGLLWVLKNRPNNIRVPLIEVIKKLKEIKC